MMDSNGTDIEGVADNDQFGFSVAISTMVNF